MKFSKMKYTCNRKRLAQVTNDRSSKSMTGGAIVPEHADGESARHALRCKVGVANRRQPILKPTFKKNLNSDFSAEQCANVFKHKNIFFS